MDNFKLLLSTNLLLICHWTNVVHADCTSGLASLYFDNRVPPSEDGLRVSSKREPLKLGDYATLPTKCKRFTGHSCCSSDKCVCVLDGSACPSELSPVVQVSVQAENHCADEYFGYVEIIYNTTCKTVYFTSIIFRDIRESVEKYNYTGAGAVQMGNLCKIYEFQHVFQKDRPVNSESNCEEENCGEHPCGTFAYWDNDFFGSPSADIPPNIGIRVPPKVENCSALSSCDVVTCDGFGDTLFKCCTAGTCVCVPSGVVQFCEDINRITLNTNTFNCNIDNEKNEIFYYGDIRFYGNTSDVQYFSRIALQSQRNDGEKVFEYQGVGSNQKGYDDGTVVTTYYYSYHKFNRGFE